MANTTTPLSWGDFINKKRPCSTGSFIFVSITYPSSDNHHKDCDYDTDHAAAELR